MAESDDPLFQYQLAVNLSVKRRLGTTESPIDGVVRCHDTGLDSAIDLVIAGEAEKRKSKPKRSRKRDQQSEAPASAPAPTEANVIQALGSVTLDDEVTVAPLPYHTSSNNRLADAFEFAPISANDMLKAFASHVAKAGIAVSENLSMLGYVHLSPRDMPEFWSYQEKWDAHGMKLLKESGQNVPVRPMKFDIAGHDTLAVVTLGTHGKISIFLDPSTLTITLYSHKTDRAFQLRSEHLVFLAEARGLFDLAVPPNNVIIPSIPVRQSTDGDGTGDPAFL